MEKDFEFTEVRCPKCGFWNDVMRRQIRLGERLICKGCHEDIQLGEIALEDKKMESTK